MPVQNDNKTPSDETGEKAQKTVTTGRGAAPTTTSKSEAKSRVQDEETIPQSYVWLANGEVLLVNDEDLPGASGAHNPHGHWEKDGTVYQVVAVYPAGEKAE